MFPIRAQILFPQRYTIFHPAFSAPSWGFIPRVDIRQSFRWPAISWRPTFVSIVDFGPIAIEIIDSDHNICMQELDSRAGRPGELNAEFHPFTFSAAKATNYSQIFRFRSTALPFTPRPLYING